MENKLKTERQKELYKYLVEGLSNREIASKMFVQERSVKELITTVYKKIGVKSRAQLIVQYYKSEWIPKELESKEQHDKQDDIIVVPKFPDIIPKPLQKSDNIIELPVGISGLADEVCEQF